MLINLTASEHDSLLTALILLLFSLRNDIDLNERIMIDLGSISKKIGGEDGI